MGWVGYELGTSQVGSGMGMDQEICLAINRLIWVGPLMTQPKPNPTQPTHLKGIQMILEPMVD